MDRARFVLTPTIFFGTVDGWDSDSGDEKEAADLETLQAFLAAEPVDLVEGYHYEVYDRDTKETIRTFRPAD